MFSFVYIYWVFLHILTLFTFTESNPLKPPQSIEPSNLANVFILGHYTNKQHWPYLLSIFMTVCVSQHVLCDTGAQLDWKKKTFLVLEFQSYKVISCSIFSNVHTRYLLNVFNPKWIGFMLHHVSSRVLYKAFRFIFDSFSLWNFFKDLVL